MKVSTYRCEITPTGKFFPCYLMGHAIRTEPAEGIMDKLWATALLLEVDGERLLWVTVELIGLEKSYTDSLRAEFAEKYGIAAENINISYVHTHSAPEYMMRSIFSEHGAVEGYMDYVREQIVIAVDKCFEQEPAEAKAYYRTVQIDGCYGNRNGKDKPCDKSFTTLAFRSGEKVVAGAAHFTCHSTVLGPQNRLVSSDLAGYVARALEKEWGVYPIVMIGAAGDMSNRLFRQGNDLAELERVGGELMSQVLCASEHELKLSRPRVEVWRFDESYQPEKAKKEAQYREIQAKVANAKNFDEKKVYTSALAIAKNGLECKTFRLELDCRYIDMGELRLFIIPAELFSRFGLMIKQAMGGECPICWCYSNYSAGYLGNKEDYGASFETAASDIPIGTTERIVGQMLDFINKVK